MNDLGEKNKLRRDDYYYRLKQEIEEFLYDEAELLDQRNFKEWLDILSDDLIYFMPIRRNVKFGAHNEKENTREGYDISWFEEDKRTLSKRIDQIHTGKHWAEEPLSRVSRMITNIQLQNVKPTMQKPYEVGIKSRFLIYQNRSETECNTFYGKRSDILRLESGGWKLIRREIILDQNILMAKNLSIFF